MPNEVDPRIIAKYIMQYQAQEDNLVKYQLETKSELENFKNELLGLEFDEEQNKWQPCEYKDKLVNSKGAHAIVGLIRPDVSKIVSLSDFGDDEINNMGLEDLNEFTYYLIRHKDDYEFKSLQTISVILGRVNKINYATMKKARGAGERDTLRKQFTHVESEEKSTVIQKQPQTKLFGGLFDKRIQ